MSSPSQAPSPLPYFVQVQRHQRTPLLPLCDADNLADDHHPHHNLDRGSDGDSDNNNNSGSDSDDTDKRPLPIALQFDVRFRPNNALLGKTTPTTQTVKIVFDGDFEPLQNTPLSLHVSARPDAALVPTQSTDAYEQPLHNVCVIEETIDLFQSQLPPASTRLWLWFSLWLWLWPSTSINSSRMVRLALAVLIQIIVIVVAIVVALSVPVPPRFLPSPSASFSTPIDALLRIRQSPLALFDDLVPLVRSCVNAPLPLVAGTHDLVRKHYSNPYNPSLPPSPARAAGAAPRIDPRNVTISVFLAHVSSASSELCNAASSWAISSRSPLKHDLLLLCQSLSSLTAGLSSTWTRVSGSAMVFWPASLSLALFYLGEALRDYLAYQATGRADSHADLSLLQTLNDILFRVRPSDNPQEHSFPSLVEAAHRLSDDVEDLETETAQLVTRLTLLTSILSDNGIVATAAAASSGHRGGSRNTSPGWLVMRRMSEVDLTLLRTSAAHDAIAPLLQTCTALAWVVGVTRRELNLVVRRLQGAGNLTKALLAGTPSWAMETDGGDGKNERTRTIWYIPSLHSVLDDLEDTTAWARREAWSSQADWDWWLRETVAYWES